MTTKRIKHCIGDIVIASGSFYGVSDRVVKVVDIHTKGEHKGRIVCKDINGHGYIGHNNDFFAYEEIDKNGGLWEVIDHNHQWFVNKPVKELSEEDVLRERIKELEKRNGFFEKVMVDLLENIGGK